MKIHTRYMITMKKLIINRKIIDDKQSFIHQLANHRTKRNLKEDGAIYFQPQQILIVFNRKEKKENGGI